MKKQIFAAALILATLPFSAFAQEETGVTGKIENDVWYIDTEVILNGENLNGPMPSKSKLCFAPEVQVTNLLCFGATHPNIIKWGPSNITFVPPKNTPPAGVVVLVHPYIETKCETLFGEQSCIDKEARKEIVIDSYKAHPFISQVVNKQTGNVVHHLEVGYTYEIQGYRFGDFGFGIYINNWLLSKDDIKSWSHDSIVFTLTEFPEKATELRVHNGAGKGNPWSLSETPDPIVPATSSSSSSVPPLPPIQGSLIDAGSGISLEVPSDDGTIFPDVATDHPYYSAITWATAVNVVSGYEDGSFRPDRAVSRAEFLKMIMATNKNLELGEVNGSVFPDVRPRDWFAAYVMEAVNLKLASGYADRTFRPDASVKVSEALKMAYRFFGVPTLDPRGDEWWARYYEHALTNKILFTQLNPDQEMSRKDTVWMILQILQWKSRQMCVEVPQVEE